LKNPISFDELKPILLKNKSIQLSQEKWYKNISEGHIQIKNELYTLMTTSYKRNLIYKNDEFVDTTPIYLNNGKRT
jgi:hypothetical protein